MPSPETHTSRILTRCLNLLCYPIFLCSLSLCHRSTHCGEESLPLESSCCHRRSNMADASTITNHVDALRLIRWTDQLLQPTLALASRLLSFRADVLQEHYLSGTSILDGQQAVRFDHRVALDEPPLPPHPSDLVSQTSSRIHGPTFNLPPAPTAPTFDLDAPFNLPLPPQLQASTWTLPSICHRPPPPLTSDLDAAFNLPPLPVHQTPGRQVWASQTCHRPPRPLPLIWPFPSTCHRSLSIRPWTAGLGLQTCHQPQRPLSPVWALPSICHRPPLPLSSIWALPSTCRRPRLSIRP